MPRTIRALISLWGSFIDYMTITVKKPLDDDFDEECLFFGIAFY